MTGRGENGVTSAHAGVGSGSHAPTVGSVERLLRAPWLPWALVALAVAFRVGHYAANPAVWLDEAFLLDNLFDRSVPELLERLDHDQAAPFGFLLVEWVVMRGLGISEYALRIVPMVASVLSPLLLLYVARRSLSREAVPVALAVFACSQPAIRYAAEVKPYSVDLAVAVMLMLAALSAAPGKRSHLSLWVLGVLGAVAVWFSFPAAFVLAGAGVTMGVIAVHRRDWPRLGTLGAVSALWLGSFAVYYGISLRDLGAQGSLTAWWSHAFAPFPPTSASDVNWFLRAFFAVFRDPVGLEAPGLGALACVLGIYAMFRRDRERALLLVSPVAAALVASASGRYPFTGRFLLFAMPLLVLFAAEGVETIRREVRAPLIATVATLLLVLPPFATSAYRFARPEPAQGVRPAMRHLMEHHEDGDGVFVYYWAHYPFRYYARRFGFGLEDYKAWIPARNDLSYHERDINRMRGRRRVWFLFAPVPENLGGGEQQFFETRLEEAGKRLDAYRSRGATLLLYDLSEPTERADDDDT